MNDTSPKQITANKQNAQVSTGPKTSEGKAISKYNALKHGLLSKEVLFKNEDEQTLLEISKKLRTEIAPQSELELMMVDRIIANYWRLKRLLSQEQGEVMTSSGGLTYDAEKYFRYKTMLERGIYKALHELQRIQSARNGERPPAPLAVDVDISGKE